jgi:hypothetical protein
MPYSAFGAEEKVALSVTAGRGHGMDDEALPAFLSD